MKKIVVTEANSVRSSNWKRRGISWDILLGKVKNPRVVNVKYDQMMSMSKEEKSDYKDGHCFVGAEFSGSRRRKQDVLKRTLITLDVEPEDDKDCNWTIDDVAQTIKDLNYQAVLYTTISHGENHPRCRVIVDVDRDMEPEEYEPVARWYADQIGMEKVDRTTFDINRAMYYPSITVDGIYHKVIVYGDLLPVDDILNKYNDWTDASEYPRCPSEKVIEKNFKSSDGKIADPTTKDSIIGDFCRAYTITEAIKRFELPYDVAGSKATYIHGSSSYGCLIFENKWIYSFHATDPISGLECNAYDLVRINLFGDDSESYNDMMDLITKDETVMREHKKREAERVTKMLEVQQEIEEWNWEEHLKVRRNKTGDVVSIERNIVNFEQILENDPELKGKIRMDNFTSQICITGAVPWLEEKDTKIFKEPPKNGKLMPKYKWQQKDFDFLQGYISRKYMFLEDKDKLRTALANVANRHSFNEVRDYFRNLPPWDGVPRLETLFIDFLGAEDNIYTREVTKTALVACATRVFSNDGVKYDYLPILYSKQQGIGKSTLVSKIGMIQNGWFTDSIKNLSNPKYIGEMVEGKLICEIGELSAITKAEADDIKQTLSSVSDRFRPAYDKWAIDRSRKCIFIGTANKINLKDDENRRFLPIKCAVTKPVRDVWHDLTQDYIDKVWAEAYYLMQQGKTPLYVTDAIKDIAKAYQIEFRDKNPLEGVIEVFLNKEIFESWYNMELPAMRSWYGIRYPNDNDTTSISSDRNYVKCERDRVCIPEIWTLCLGRNLSELNGNRKASNDVTKAMEHIDGWEEYESSFGIFGRAKGYRRIKE